MQLRTGIYPGDAPMTNEQLAGYAAGAPCPHVDVMAMAEEITQLRGNLSLAEEGLANYALEVASLQGQRDHWLEIAREKDSLIDTQDAAQTSLHAENVRLREENEQLQSRLEGSQAAAAVGEREVERLRGALRECRKFIAPRADESWAWLDQVLDVTAHEPLLCACIPLAPRTSKYCGDCGKLIPEGAPRGAGSEQSGEQS